jgi:two-component system cell cycle sensor histidine kinase/response regulator CckA
VRSEVKVLVVDDSNEIRRLVTCILENEGHEVLPVANPLDALQIIEDGKRPMDVLLTDFTMPEMTGVELIRGAMRCEHAPAKVGLMSAYMDDEDALLEMILQGVHFFDKPFTYEELSNWVAGSDSTPLLF